MDKHTTEQHGPSGTSLWQLWLSPSLKNMSSIQRLMQSLWKDNTLEIILLKTQRYKLSERRLQTT